MTDAPLSLRAILSLIAVLLVIGVYFFSARASARRREKGANRRSASARQRRRARGQQAAPAKLPPDLNSTRDVENVAPELPAVEPPVVREDAELDELPVVTRDPPVRKKRKRAKDSQLRFSFESEPSAAPAADATRDPTILAMQLRAPNKRHFEGAELQAAFQQAGLSFGEMDIYHHYGAGELQTETPLFSVANIYEPGTFDPKQINDLTTDGLTLFMQLPTALEGPVAFELFLSAAQELATALDGQLFSTPEALLDGAQITKMRETAARYVG